MAFFFTRCVEVTLTLLGLFCQLWLNRFCVKTPCHILFHVMLRGNQNVELPHTKLLNMCILLTGEHLSSGHGQLLRALRPSPFWTHGISELTVTLQSLDSLALILWLWRAS